MNTKITILLFLNLTILFSYGQNVQRYSYEQEFKIKRETEIFNEYNYTFFRGDDMHLLKKGKVKTDTIIKEYNFDGILQNPYHTSDMVYRSISLDSLELIHSNNNIEHKREYWSDTTYIDIFTQKYEDSIIQIKTSNIDTIQINKSYFINGQLIKCHNRDFRESYGKFNEIIVYKKKTRNHEVATIITTYYEDCLTDTIKIDYNKNRKKTYVFNTYENEWFVKEEVKYNKRKRKKVFLETFYHVYHKHYFTTKTTIEYNNFGLPISEIVYDTYLNHIESSTEYIYEYY